MPAMQILNQVKGGLPYPPVSPHRQMGPRFWCYRVRCGVVTPTR